jgi:hypothetical protein
LLLQGNIDAAVNGGVAKYRAAFFTEEFIYSSPQHLAALERLAALLAQQSVLLQVRALSWLARLFSSYLLTFLNHKKALLPSFVLSIFLKVSPLPGPSVGRRMNEATCRRGEIYGR